MAPTNGQPLRKLGIGAFDTGFWTVMSYEGLSGSAAFGWQATPMPLDILAIQEIYGANMSYRTGNDIYVFVQRRHRQGRSGMLEASTRLTPLVCLSESPLT